MVTLKTEYSETNASLQANINEALNQLGNLSNTINTIGDPPSGITAPTVGGSNPQFPNAPPEPDIKPFEAVPLSPSGITFKTPGGSAGGVNVHWAPPVAPQFRSSFDQFFTGDDDTPEEIIARANAEVSRWVDDYFPALKDCFNNEPEDWICDVISGVRPLGNSETAIEVAWRTAKANQHREIQATKSTLYAEFASRGFSMPPGAMVAAMSRLHERGFDAASAANRDAAIKDVDIQATLLQTAVETGARLKQGLLGIMADYYRIVSSLTNDASQYGIDRARIQADADARFTEALLKYSDINQNYHKSKGTLMVQNGANLVAKYRGDVAAAEAEIRGKETAARIELETSKINSENQRAQVSAETEIARTNYDVYRTGVDAESTRITTELEYDRIALEAYKAELEGLKAEAESRAYGAKAQALGGVAAGFGDVAAAAANASGTLIARIEGV